MQTPQFYELLDKELNIIIQENTEEFKVQKLKAEGQQKGYALLIWFLKFYAPNKIMFRDYITDGRDDQSCDIIFSAPENGSKIFYVVQSKWNNKSNVEGQIKSEEVKKALTDFELILRKNKRKGKNELFNKKLDELHEHLASADGKVKFIFFGLAHFNPNAEEYIEKFKKDYAPNIKFEFIDIERIKRDYIEFNYKKIEVRNPLNYQYYNPETSKINLPIERIPNAMGKGDHIKMEKPYEAYVFLVKPKAIFELFDKYGFALFFGNVRNPLPESNYNQNIVETLKNQPSMFWYFNNGITAITKLMEVGVTSENINLMGLQVINGAQTVYSVYSAYKEANEVDRKVMDAEARIMLRVVKSNDAKVNLEITRYTNSQNPMQPEDFWANDPIQIRLQEESFRYEYRYPFNIWYEKRRGEFRELPKNVLTSSNTSFGLAYLACWLQKPYLIDEIPYEDAVNLIFTSRRKNMNGLYETIFNINTKFDDLISSFFLSNILVHGKFAKYLKESFNNTLSFLTKEKRIFINNFWLPLALAKTVFLRYYSKKYPSNKGSDLAQKLEKFYFDTEQNFLLKIYLFIEYELSQNYVKKYPNSLTKEVNGEIISISRRQIFEKLNDHFERLDFEPTDIEDIELPKN